MANRNGTLTPSLKDVDVSELKLLSVEDILSADDLPEEVIDCPEWGGPVKVKAFTKARQLAIRSAAMGENNEMDMEKFELLLFVHGVIEPEFTKEQVPLLLEKSGAVIDRILERVMELSGLTEEARKRAKARFPA